MQRDSGISIDDQAQMIEGRCLERNWQLTRTFVDAGVSGSVPLGQRPSFPPSDIACAQCVRSGAADCHAQCIGAP
jgi:hypothetical protein